MTAYIQSLLFEPCNMSSATYIDDIRELMFTMDYKKKYANRHAISKQPDMFAEKKTEENNSPKYVDTPVGIESPVVVSQHSYRRPRQKDTLFWCMYIAKYGYDEYLEIQSNYGTRQLDIQQKIGAHIKKNMVLLKNVNTRITKAATQEILSELLTDSRSTSMHVLYAYAVYYNMNLILMHPSNEYYLEIQSDTMEEDMDIFLMQKDDRQQYSIREAPLSVDEYRELVDNKFKLDSHIRPLKAIGNYKTEDIYRVAEKVGIDLTTKRTKTELYNVITEKIQWY